MRERYFLGVDLGQKQDYTAIAVVERAEGPAAPARSWLVARGSSIHGRMRTAAAGRAGVGRKASWAANEHECTRMEEEKPDMISRR